MLLRSSRQAWPPIRSLLSEAAVDLVYTAFTAAPHANVAAMGAAFLVAISHGAVIGVGADAIAIVS